MQKKMSMPKIEQERLFGAGVDLFKSRYAAKFLHNILRNIGLREIRDNDFYRSLATYVTGDEIAGVYDDILPKKKREALAESHTYRNPPEIGEDDADDCLAYLGRNINRRKKMWHELAALYAVREKDFEAQLKRKNRPVSAVETRFLEMKELFNLSQTEMEILLAIFFSASLPWKSQGRASPSNLFQNFSDSACDEIPDR